MRTQKLLEAFDFERKEWAAERKELLERIQRPEVRPATVDPDYVPSEPPKDAGEMAHVGEIGRASCRERV